MSIELQKLEFSNMFSYGENNSLQLNSERITQLSAINGVGKTSIAHILQELLFSKNTKGIKKGDILNRHSGAKTWSGSLDFSVNSKQYNISVKRTGASTKVILLENGVDISEHKVIDTYKKINNILGLDFNVFSQLTYQSSTDLLEFLKATDTNRKKFLINLFNLEKYLIIGDKIKLESGKTDKELRDLRTELATIESFLNSTTIPETQTEVDVPEIDQQLAVRLSEIDTSLQNYSDTCKRIDKNNMYIKEQQELEFDISLIKPDPFEYTEEYQALKHDLVVIKNNISTLTKEITCIDTTNVCSSCGQAIDNSQQLKIKEKKQVELSELQNKYENNLAKAKKWGDEYLEAQKAHTKWAENKQKIDRFEQLAQLIDLTIETEYPNIGNLENEKKQIKATHIAQTNDRNAAIKHNNSVSAHNAKVEALTEQKGEFLNRQQALINDINKVLEKANHLTILKKAFSPTGIVAFKLENLTKNLENSINSYLADLSDGQFQVEFSLEKEKLNIDIIDAGVKAPIETASGGEYSRIQTAILLAIRDLLAKLSNNGINLLFLDEITGVLDEKGKEELIEVLSKDRKSKLNVFLISHDFSHPLVPKINIQKQDKISYISN